MQRGLNEPDLSTHYAFIWSYELAAVRGCPGKVPLYWLVTLHLALLRSPPVPQRSIISLRMKG